MEAFARGAVRVRVPATSANLGPGFDALGLALDLHDEVEAEVLPEPGALEVGVVGEGAADVPLDARHLVVRAMSAGFEALGRPMPGLRLHCTNRIPHGRGMGSSSAAIVAALLLAEALVDPVDYPPGEVLRLAARLEGHPDNVAPCLLGGVTIAWEEAAGARGVRLEPHPELAALLFVPPEPVATERARGLLPAAVPHADASFNAGRAALLVEALTRRPDLLHAATEDRLHQGYRAPAMVASAALVHELRGRGAAAVISGAGPTVLALGTRGALEPLAQMAPVGFEVRALSLARTGGVVVS